MKLSAFFAGAAALLTAGSASAAIVTVNFTGIYDSGSPRTGQTFTGTFAYDSTIAPVYTGDLDGSGPADRAYANVLVGGFTFTDAGGTSTLLSANATLSILRSATTTAFNLSGNTPGASNYFQQFYFQTTDTSFAAGSLPTSFPALGTGTTAIGFRGDSGQGTINSLSVVSAVAGVPEPATWAMMIAGFGGIGGSLRRRRQPAFATA